MPHITGHQEDVVHDARGDSRRVVTERRTIDDGGNAVYDQRVDTVGTGRHWYEFDLAGRINTVLFALLAGLETLLALRFTLFAFGANSNSGFVDFIYDFSGFFIEPFENAFANRTWDEGIIEVNTLLAMGVYFLIFAVIAMLIAAIVPRIGGYRDDGTDATYRRTRVTHSGH
jgi:Fe2+ transport system protein B